MAMTVLPANTQMQGQAPAHFFDVFPKADISEESGLHSGFRLLNNVPSLVGYICEVLNIVKLAPLFTDYL
jgi:hypothetical protein